MQMAAAQSVVYLHKLRCLNRTKLSCFLLLTNLVGEQLAVFVAASDKIPNSDSRLIRFLQNEDCDNPPERFFFGMIRREFKKIS